MTFAPDSTETLSGLAAYRAETRPFRVKVPGGRNVPR
jgi:hypothetical protein